MIFEEFGEFGDGLGTDDLLDIYTTIKRRDDTYPYCWLMLSTPAPIPTSIMPALIAFAMSTQAISPLEHCLFKLLTAVLAGKPAANAAALNSFAPGPVGIIDRKGL